MSGDGVAPNWLDSLNEPIVAKVYGENGIETVALTVGTDISEGRIEYEVRGWSDKCGERHKAGWFCSRAYDHTGACAMWPVSHDARMSEMLATPARQSRADSFMESLTNIAIGLAVSQVANLIVLPLVFHVPVSNGQALALGLIYTAISLVRSYALRRAFNGRSVWQAIKGHWA